MVAKRHHQYTYGKKLNLFKMELNKNVQIFILNVICQ